MASKHKTTTVAGCTALLHSKAPINKRRAGIGGLRRLAMKRAVGAREGLIEALKRPEWPLRSAAAQALREIALDAETLALLVQLAARDESPWVRSAATWRLKQPGEVEDLGAGEALAPLFEDEDPEIRARVTRLAGRLPICDEARLVAMARDAAWPVRAAAFAALGRRGEGLEARVAGLDDPDPSAREAAAEALAGLEGAKGRLLEVARRDESPRVRTAALIGLSRAEGSAVISDVARRALDDADTQVRCHAAELLAVQGEAARPALPKMLERLSDDANVGFALKRSLGLLGRQDQVVVDGLWGALDNPMTRIRVRALSVLGEIEPKTGPQDERRLLQLLDDPSPSVWSAVSWFVRRAPAWSAEGVTQLCARASSRGHHTRLRALELMQAIKLEKDALHDVLWWRLRDSVPAVRIRALDLVNQRTAKARGAFPQVIRRLYEGEGDVAGRAKEICQRLQGQLPRWFDVKLALRDPYEVLIGQLNETTPVIQGEVARRAMAHARWYHALTTQMAERRDHVVEATLPAEAAMEEALGLALEWSERFALMRRSVAAADPTVTARAREREMAWLLAALMEQELGA